MASPFKHILQSFSSHMSSVTRYRDYGTAHQSEVVFPKALKNTEDKRGGRDMFQFEKREDIQEGDIIIQKNSPTLWRVTELEDFLDGDEYIMFDVFVEKASATGSPRPRPGIGHTINIGGDVTGGFQVGNVNSHQQVSVTSNQQWAAPLAELRNVIAKSDLDDIEKEDVEHELKRVEDLAKRGDEKSKPKIMERLTVIEKAISVSDKLAKVAIPIITAIRAYF